MVYIQLEYDYETLGISFYKVFLSYLNVDRDTHILIWFKYLIKLKFRFSLGVQRRTCIV